MTPEQIENITQMAMYLFGPDEIAVILDMAPADLDEVDARQAMQRGRLMAQAEVRKSIYNMAKSGSTSAQKEFLKLAADVAPNILPPPSSEPGETSTTPAAGGLDLSGC